ITGSRRVALLAVVIFASSSDLELWTKFSTPFVLGVVYLAFAVVESLATPHTAKHRLLALVFVGSLTLTHPLAAGLAVVLILGAGILSYLNATVRRRRAQYSLANFGLLLAVVVIGYWIFLALRLLHSFAPLI